MNRPRNRGSTMWRWQRTSSIKASRHCTTIKFGSWEKSFTLCGRRFACICLSWRFLKKESRKTQRSWMKNWLRRNLRPGLDRSSGDHFFIFNLIIHFIFFHTCPFFHNSFDRFLFSNKQEAKEIRNSIRLGKAQIYCLLFLCNLRIAYTFSVVFVPPLWPQHK